MKQEKTIDCHWISVTSSHILYTLSYDFWHPREYYWSILQLHIVREKRTSSARPHIRSSNLTGRVDILPTVFQRYRPSTWTLIRKFPFFRFSFNSPNISKSFSIIFIILIDFVMSWLLVNKLYVSKLILIFVKN